MVYWPKISRFLHGRTSALISNLLTVPCYNYTYAICIAHNCRKANTLEKVGNIDKCLIPIKTKKLLRQ